MEELKPNEINSEFMEWLKEEVLPGVWSKGVALSRAVKGIQLLSRKNGEYKFKIKTTERLLAFQVTLWPTDQDTHCTCDSKVEPCHHIVAVALAVQNGAVSASEENDETGTSTATGPRLSYRWVVRADELRIERDILNTNSSGDVSRTPVVGSLISMIGGIQSGRIQAPLPPTTSTDLKIDELLAKIPVPWGEVLKPMAEVGALTIQTSTQNFGAVKCNPNLQRPTLVIEDDHRGGISLSISHAPEPLVRFQSGLCILKLNGENTLTLAASIALPTVPSSISRENLGEFVLQQLPVFYEHFDVDLRAKNLPEIVEAEPTVEFIVHPVDAETVSVTLRISYGELAQGTVAKRDRARELELGKQVRALYRLTIDQPSFLKGVQAFELREKLSEKLPSPALDGFLTNLFTDLGSVSLENAFQNREMILEFLRMKEKAIPTKAFARHVQEKIGSIRPDDTVALENLPATVKVARKLWDQLRDYQKYGVKWLADHIDSREGALLADDMGLGKTIQTLGILQSPALVVVPTSLLFNWKEEALRFRPDLKVNVFHGPERKWIDDADLTVTTYSVLRIDEERLQKKDWACVVLDEAHVIRNPETQAAIAAFKLRAGFRLALTGTPIQNRKRDLWSLLQFILPERFLSEGEITPQALAPYFLRRTKSEVLTELPPKTYLEHQVELSTNERAYYQSAWSAAKAEIAEKIDGKTSALTLFEVLLRSRQVCDHIGLFQQSQWNESSSKLETLFELIEELSEAGHSVLVYSQWTKFLDRIQFELSAKKYPWLRLDGSTQNREEVLSNFQNSGQPMVFLLSLQAGGVGLNLTKADHVIFCDPWWNPYVELQAEDRAYRMGQEKPVTIHRLICKDTIEEKIRALQAEKRGLESILAVDNPVDDAGTSLSLKIADIEKLISS